MLLDGTVGVINDLDARLRSDDDRFAQAALVSFHEYAPWYAQLLSSLVLLVGDDSIVSAHANVEPESTEAHVILFTERSVVVSSCDIDSGLPPAPTLIGRHAITSLQVSSSMRADVEGWAARGWPGVLRFTVEYRGLSKPLQFQASGVNPSNLQSPAPARVLLDGLRADVARSASAASPA